MKILIVTQFFDPEPNLKGLTFARELSRRGHSVQVLTGFPNYPGGTLYPGYKIRPASIETIDGIRVIRVALYPSHNRSPLRRIANYLSFALSAMLLGPLFVFRPDVIYVYQPPVTSVLPAMLVGFIHRCPVVHDVQDLWPDAVKASGMMQSQTLQRLLTVLCRWLYRSAARIVVLSPSLKTALVARGISAEKVDVIYNWANEDLLAVSPPRAAFTDDTISSDAFKVVFAGTMGTAQGLSTVLKAAQLCLPSLPEVRFIFIGAGIERASLERSVGEMKLSNVQFVPHQPMSAMPQWLRSADVLLVHLRNDPLLSTAIPSKTQAYLAMGRPIIMATTGDSADLVDRANAGLTCKPDDPDALVAAIRRVYNLEPSDRNKFGENGKNFYDCNLSMRVGIDRFVDTFKQATREAGLTKVGHVS